MDNSGTLDSFLFPVNSPYVQNQQVTSAYAFDYENERNIISAAKFGRVSFVGPVGEVTIDGPDRTIIVNDGTNDRVLIGKF